MAAISLDVSLNRGIGSSAAGVLTLLIGAKQPPTAMTPKPASPGFAARMTPKTISSSVCGERGSSLIHSQAALAVPAASTKISTTGLLIPGSVRVPVGSVCAPQGDGLNIALVEV